jgi:cell division septation protein DedD
MVKLRVVQVRASLDPCVIRGWFLGGGGGGVRQMVGLLAGAIEVGAAGEPAVRLDQPLQFYQRDKGKTQPVGMVEPKQLAQWSRETDIESGKGAARRGGRFAVELATLESQSGAGAISRQLQEAGYPAQVAQRKVGEKLTYTVRIRQLPSREDAEALAGQLKGKYGVRDPKVVG